MISSSLGSTNVLAIKQPLLARIFVGFAMLIASFFMHGCSTLPFTNISVFDGRQLCLQAVCEHMCLNFVGTMLFCPARQ